MSLPGAPIRTYVLSMQSTYLASARWPAPARYCAAADADAARRPRRTARVAPMLPPDRRPAGDLTL